MAEETEKEKRKAPATLFQLFVFLVKNFIKNLPQTILIALITAAVILVAHTYLLVVVNDGFGMGDSKALNSILMLKDTAAGVLGEHWRAVNVALFWMMLSYLFWSTIAQIRGCGIKIYALKIVVSFTDLLSDLLEKPGTFILSLFLGGICTGILMGVISGNPLVSLLLSVIIFLSVSARGTSLLLLALYLTWSDLQRLFRVKPRKEFYIDIVCTVLRGLSLGLLIYTFIPFVKYGGVLQYIVLAAFTALLALNITKKRKPTVTTLMILTGSTVFFTATGADAHDGGWTEAGGSFWGWAGSEGAWDAIKRGLKPALSAASLLVGFLPLVGDIKDAQEALLGIDLLTGERLTAGDRMVTAIAGLVPVVNGKALRETLKVGEEAAEFVAKHGDELGHVVNDAGDVAKKAADGTGKAGVPRTGPKGVDPNHHNANVLVRDANGNVILHQRLISGNMTAEEKSLGFPRNTLASHTEARAVTQTPLKEGQTMIITGQHPPCPSCKGYMNRAMKETGAEIRYQWRQGGKTQRWP